MLPSIYINLEDDVTKIVTRLKKEKSREVVLVCPKRCFLFNDGINLRLLKKQTDLLEKKVYILTMDERGQAYAAEAGFELKQVPKAGGKAAMSDIGNRSTPTVKKTPEVVLGASRIKPKKNTKVLPAPLPNVPELSEKEQEVMEEEVILPKSKTQSIFPKELESAYKEKNRKSQARKLVWTFSFLALLSAAAVVLVVLPKATIAVYPKKQNLTRDLEIGMSSAIKEPDPARLVMPASKVSKSLNTDGQFQTQGKKEVGNKAAGTVVIYNFTGAPINLKAQTTILTLNGKNYTFTKDVVLLKPTRYKNAQTKEIDEASLSEPVEVMASQGGEGYNVPAGTRLEITNQVFGSRPQVLYAKASSAITGGTSRYLSVVSEEDLSRAKSELAKKLLVSMQNELLEQNLVLDEKSFVFQQEDFASDSPVGTESPKFTATLKGSAEGLAYNLEQLNELVLTRVSESLNSHDSVQVKAEKPLDAKFKTVDLVNENGVLLVKFEGVSLAKTPNIESLKNSLKGKTQEQAAEIVKNAGEVDMVEITLAPVWQKWLPFLSSRISIVIR